MSHPILPPSDSDGQPLCTSKDDLQSPSELPYGMSWGLADPNDALDDKKIWLRWNPAEATAIRVLSVKELHYVGHWLPSSRTFRLCTYPGCLYCPTGNSAARAKAGAQQHRYVLVVEQIGLPAGTQRLWEFGTSAAEQLSAITGYQRTAGGTVTRQRELRGLSLTLCRDGSLRNSPVVVTHAAGVAWPEIVPEPIDMPGLLAASWRRAAVKDGKGQFKMKLPGGF
jgi:hypothetical protein